MGSGFSHQMSMRALQLLSLKQTMTIPVKKMCWQRASDVRRLHSDSGWLAAQTDAAKTCRRNETNRPNLFWRLPILALLRPGPR